MNFDFAKPNLDDKVLKYVSMAQSIAKWVNIITKILSSKN